MAERQRQMQQKELFLRADDTGLLREIGLLELRAVDADVGEVRRGRKAD